MKRFLWTSLIVALLLSSPKISLADEAVYGTSIPTVDNVDLDSYVGFWHEVLRMENDFQDNEPKPGDGPCFNTTAEYSFLKKGKIGVVNTCYRLSGPEVANAKAKVVKGSNNAKLKVNFTGVPFLEWLGIGSGDYWILALGEKDAKSLYSWVLVGSPDREYGWVLSRNPFLAPSEIEKAMKAAEAVGYRREAFKSFQK